MKHLLRSIGLACALVVGSIATAQTAPDIASLKQYWVAAPSSTIYTLTGNPVVSWVEPAPDGTRLYIQDAGGAIALHLPTPPATLPIRPGDELGTLSGTLGLNAGVLTLFCAAPPEVVSSGNPVTPEPVDLLSLTLSPTRYESMLVETDNVSLQGGGGTLFRPNQHYTIARQSANATIATLFPDANYLGTVIPTAPFNLTAIADYNRLTGELALTPRMLSDISYSTGNLTTGSWTADDVFAADGYLNIRSLTRQPLEVYSLLGQVVMNRWVDPGLTELQMPAGGVYIVRLGGLTKRIGIP